MTRRFRSVLLLLAGVAAGSHLLAAQPPASPEGSATARPAAPRGPRPAPTNIKALPKTITGDEIGKLMREYTGDLGVQCEFCHAQDPATKRLNFASDANPLKESARFMIEMTADLNDKYLAEMPSRRYADPITCGTCHQGHSHPEIFVPKPQGNGNRPANPGATPPAS